MRYILLLGLGLSLCFGLGCLREDRPDLPVYLKLEGAKVRIGEGNFTSTVALKDFWMSHNANNLGVHRIPKVIPLILEEGNNTVFISGGVFENGLSSFRLPYPFWRAEAVDINANPLDTVVINPTFQYLNTDSIIKIAFEETFESGASLKFIDFFQGENKTTLFRRTEAAFQGQLGGRADFTQTNFNLEVIGSPSIGLPQTGGNDIWMEITYKNNVPFTAGLFYTVATTGETGDLNAGVFFNSNNEWTTAYIHVNQQVRRIIGTALFTPYIRANAKDPESGVITTGSIMLDNIRILHFR